MKKELKKTYKNNKKDGRYHITDYLIGRYNLKTIKGNKPELYYYKKGVYLRGEEHIAAKLSVILEQEYSINAKNEILNSIYAKTAIERDEFVVDKYLINLNNGVYDVRTGLFSNHTPAYLFLNKIPTDYDPNAKCEKIDEFLQQLLPERDIMILKEWFGYVLFRDYFIKKALILTGEKNTGKTTVIDLFIKLIGLENASGVSLQQIASDRFSTADLHHKHVNIYDDMSANDVKDSGRFKMLTGGSPISGEKKFTDRFIFYNYAKLTFACNRIPNISDNDDDAYFDRWIIVKFKKPVEHPNKFLLDEITTPAEMSGLLNEMLNNLNRILVNQEFTYQKTHEEIKTEMLRAGSAVAAFVFDCIEEAIGDFTSKADMHYYFSCYTKKHNLPHLEIKKFGKEIFKYAKYMTEGRHCTSVGYNNVHLSLDGQKLINADDEQYKELLPVKSKPPADKKPQKEKKVDEKIPTEDISGEEPAPELPDEEARQLQARLDAV